jgi:hypothetical protein
MYSILLSLHSVTRWLVLLILLVSLLYSWKRYQRKVPFTSKGETLRLWTVIISHIQASLGLILYFMSPIVTYFLFHFSEAVHERELRFFGMEHITVMISAVVVITIGSAKVKREPNDVLKHKKMLIWFGIGLFLILTSIPWSFSPLINRPNFRF